MFASLTKVSMNVKTGAIPVSCSSKAFCPDTCQLKGNGCYAEAGPVAIHWRKITMGERGKVFTDFCKDIAKLPRKQLWRHNVAGDLPSDGKVIDSFFMETLVKANKGKRGFTYTHHDMSLESNRQEVIKAINNGFTVNLSANTLEDVDRLKALDIAPVVCLLPAEHTTKTTKTPAGHTIVTCPAAIDKTNQITCNTCQFCQKADRKVIIGFPVHGSCKKKAGKVFSGEGKK